MISNYYYLLLLQIYKIYFFLLNQISPVAYFIIIIVKQSAHFYNTTCTDLHETHSREKKTSSVSFVLYVYHRHLVRILLFFYSFRHSKPQMRKVIYTIFLVSKVSKKFFSSFFIYFFFFRRI